jgi:hypothetical protein
MTGILMQYKNEKRRYLHRIAERRDGKKKEVTPKR